MILYQKRFYTKENKIRLKKKIITILEKKDYLKINEIEFEIVKLDVNYINFIISCTNLREKNYNIEECNNDKIIFGNIQPSLITSSAAFIGLLYMQIYG